MNEKLENPLAFPGQMENGLDSRAGNFNEGMTLRDYFAGAALTGFLANRGRMGTPPETVEASFHMADAMLVERKKHSHE